MISAHFGIFNNTFDLPPLSLRSLLQIKGPFHLFDLLTCTLDCWPRRDSAKFRFVVLHSNAGRRPSGATAPRLGFLLYYRVRVGEGVKNSAAGKGVLGPRSLEYSLLASGPAARQRQD